MKLLKKVSAVILAVFVLFTVPVLADSHNKKLEQSDEAYFFNAVVEFILQVYNFDITKDELLSRTIQNLITNNPKALDEFLRALLGSLDEYSEFYSPEEWKAINSQLERTFGGIGVRLVKQGHYVTVIEVFDNSPAQKAGIQVGDKIIEIDGESVLNRDHAVVSNKVAGEIGTTVHIKVLRGDEEISFDIVREELRQSTVEYIILDENVSYLRISTFNSSTLSELEQALKEIDAKGANKIIMDLRSNPGGYVDVVVQVAKRFVPAGVIATAAYKYKDIKEVYTSDLKEKKYDLLVLVNEYTASAAEILASAIQESGAGKLIGERTYGKAVIQQFFQLYRAIDGERWCKITTGTYLTRNGNQINKIGIAPDYDVKNRKVKYEQVKKEKMVYSKKYQVGDVGKGVLAAKQRLNILGYYIGEMDEYFNEQMAEAVAQFQADSNLFPYGVLDVNTQILLENTAAEVMVTIDCQLITALEMFEANVNVPTLEQ